jgi:hypothetical protein
MMRDIYDIGRTDSGLYEIEPNAHGAWRRRQFYRELDRATRATGEIQLFRIGRGWRVVPADYRRAS